MSRPIRSLLALVVVAFALTAAACADATSPRPVTCDQSNSNTCK